MTNWEEIEDFPDYAINDRGEVLHIDKQHIVPPRLNQQGFLMVTLKEPNTTGSQKTRTVTTLVAKAFIEPPPNQHFNSVIHRDGDRQNVSADNLMWRPRWFAVRYHKQFLSDPPKVHVYVADTDEVLHIRECSMKYGLLEMDIYKNIMSGTPTWPINYDIRRYEE